MTALAAAAWLGGLCAAAGPRVAWGAVVVVAVVSVTAVVAARRSDPSRDRSGRRYGDPRTWAAAIVLACAVSAIGLLGQASTSTGPVADLASEEAVVTAALRVTSDPRPVKSRFEPRVYFRARLLEVIGRGHTWRVSAPVVVVAEESWARLRLGATVEVLGRLTPADGDATAMFAPRGAPLQRAPPDIWWRGAERVREAIRTAVAHRPPAQRALVPALVDGDDAGVDPALADDFRTTGLTHLLAVSGTNLTLVVGFILTLARWVGVRGRALLPLALAGILGFVLLARTEPSVVRAATMGAVGLLALDSRGREKAVRALGVAVVALLLLDPSMATSPGFALSVLATAGILLLAPGWSDALSRWLPRWLAELIAVPAAAQLACTPVVAALSGQVSLIAVASNMVVAPVVGPATVLGLSGGLLAMVWAPAGQLLGTGAGWCVAWIVLVATRAADVPYAALNGATGPGALVAVTVLTVLLALGGPLMLHRIHYRRRRLGAGRIWPVTAVAATLTVVLVVVAIQVLPRNPWPPPGWVMVSCDVGQGDAAVIATGAGSGVVFDVGPEPDLIDHCLDDLGIQTISTLVLTHFHADHVDGLDGALDGRRVDRILTTTLDDPAPAAADVRAEASARQIPVESVTAGETWTAGDAEFQVLRPPDPLEPPSEGSAANNASVVVVVTVAGVRLLLTGDLEPEGQADLAAAWPDLQVDVLKLPHHGSAHQDLDVLRSWQPRLVFVSVGADNDYGHPNADVLAALSATGARVLRTDQDGDLAAVVTESGLGSVTR